MLRFFLNLHFVRNCDDFFAQWAIFTTLISDTMTESSPNECMNVQECSQNQSITSLSSEMSNGTNVQGAERNEFNSLIRKLKSAFTNKVSSRNPPPEICAISSEIPIQVKFQFQVKFIPWKTSFENKNSR